LFSCSLRQKVIEHGVERNLGLLSAFSRISLEYYADDETARSQDEDMSDSAGTLGNVKGWEID